MANVANYRNIRMTQGVADAFVEAIELTYIDPSSGKVWKLNRIEGVVVTSIYGLAADAELKWSVTRRTKAAIATYLDDDCIATGGWAFALNTNGATVFALPFYHDFVDGIVVVEPELYFQLDTAGTGLAITADARLYYEEMRIPEVDILRMLAQG